MKHFYAGTFINRDDLKKIGVNYPIKLDYYKIKSNQNLLTDDITRYGIEVVKTSYINERVEIENIQIEEFAEDENIVNSILDKLKKNEVTPISARYVVEDLLKEMVS